MTPVSGSCCGLKMDACAWPNDTGGGGGGGGLGGGGLGLGGGGGLGGLREQQEERMRVPGSIAAHSCPRFGPVFSLATCAMHPATSHPYNWPPATHATRHQAPAPAGSSMLTWGLEAVWACSVHGRGAVMSAGSTCCWIAVDQQWTTPMTAPPAGHLRWRGRGWRFRRGRGWARRPALKVGLRGERCLVEFGSGSAKVGDPCSCFPPFTSPCKHLTWAMAAGGEAVGKDCRKAW